MPSASGRISGQVGAWLCTVLLSAAHLVACSGPAPWQQEPGPTSSPGAASRARVRALRVAEASLRSRFVPREQPAWLDASGADPYRIARLSVGNGFVGLLRGSKAFVVLSEELVELARVAVTETPTALCVTASGDAWVASRYANRLVRVHVDSTGAAAKTLERELPVPGVADLACGERGQVYVLPVEGTELLTLDGDARVLGRWPALKGPLRLQRQGRYLLESSLSERSLAVLELGPRGVPSREVGRIRHDGTLWAFDAARPIAGEGLLVAVAGAEDKPLVRAHGEFENIDSFVWVYELGPDGLSQRAELDVSDWGVVVPKALHLTVAGEASTLSVLGAGSGRWLRATWGRDWHAAPQISSQPVPPGASDALETGASSIVYASPLFDAWIKVDRTGTQLTRVEPERRPDLSVRLGEALFFTELMAPDNSSAGTHSRFSCETCHFEGGVDGRLHYTGRGQVNVVTKPLFGLANNRPHFSRAMDPDLSSVSHNEFRVAGAGSGTDPWFTLETSRFPWLRELGIARGVLEPLELRSALLAFLYAFSPPPNPNSQGRAQFTAVEAGGARAFREHCQGCHAARLLSDDPASEVPFGAWEELIFARNAPLVWARGDYAQTGVLPYVHERGTRIPSLRRLAQKPRYFTNGSAPDLDGVLERFRDGPAGALHDGSPAGLTSLDADARRGLLAFLRLL